MFYAREFFFHLREEFRFSVSEDRVQLFPFSHDGVRADWIWGKLPTTQFRIFYIALSHTREPKWIVYIYNCNSLMREIRCLLDYKNSDEGCLGTDCRWEYLDLTKGKWWTKLCNGELHNLHSSKFTVIKMRLMGGACSMNWGTDKNACRSLVGREKLRYRRPSYRWGTI
jgi:hypothetical protein